PNRSTSITATAARAKPSAMTKGMATDARATYLSTRWLTAALALLITPANKAGSSQRRLRLPERAKDKTDDCGARERRHRLVLDRLVEGAPEVAGNLLHPLAGLSALLGHTARHSFGLVGYLAELVGCLVLEV